MLKYYSINTKKERVEDGGSLWLGKVQILFPLKVLLPGDERGEVSKFHQPSSMKN